MEGIIPRLFLRRYSLPPGPLLYHIIMLVNEDDIEEYHRDGFVVLRP